jgi:hypothetical protein
MNSWCGRGRTVACLHVIYITWFNYLVDEDICDDPLADLVEILQGLHTTIATVGTVEGN